MLKMLKNYHYLVLWNWFSFGSLQNDCLKFAVWLFMGRSKSEGTSHGSTKSATVAGETTSTEQQRGNREEKMEDIYGPAKVGQGFGSRGVMQVRCKSVPALLHVNRYESGSKGKCIQVQPPHTLVEEWLTPNEYEEMSGSKAKDYLSSIECLGRPLKEYVDGGELRGTGPLPPPSPKLPFPWDWLWFNSCIIN